eukprot:CAMPEP_0116897734 /NCGR_PEP_ID=MMETSP0467-20121206/6636_1 /TAXON_ID=283647 /ORGANISM="Mesodinium pulex, Strain SPMC105" /LENGTH=179 /DNA_ID=CAMNT_0004569517 /DNA_START=505 /DNA_END=1044 /DNA_ORIENTATION=-
MQIHDLVECLTKLRTVSRLESLPICSIILKKKKKVSKKNNKDSEVKETETETGDSKKINLNIDESKGQSQGKQNNLLEEKEEGDEVKEGENKKKKKENKKHNNKDHQIPTNVKPKEPKVVIELNPIIKNDEVFSAFLSLKFTVGVIKTASKHPDADKLFVEQIDIGEGSERSVCSGLAP